MYILYFMYIFHRAKPQAPWQTGSFPDEQCFQALKHCLGLTKYHTYFDIFPHSFQSETLYSSLQLRQLFLICIYFQLQ